MQKSNNKASLEELEERFNQTVKKWSAVKDEYNTVKIDLDSSIKEYEKYKLNSKKIDKRKEKEILSKKKILSEKRLELYSAQDNIENAIKAIEAARDPDRKDKKDPSSLKKDYQSIMDNLEHLRKEALSYSKKKKDNLKKSSNKYLLKYGRTLSGSGRDPFGTIVLLLQIETLKKLGLSLHIMCTYLEKEKPFSKRKVSDDLAIKSFISWVDQSRRDGKMSLLNIGLRLDQKLTIEYSWSDFDNFKISSFLKQKCLITHTLFKPEINLRKLFLGDKRKILEKELTNSASLIPALENISNQKNALIAIQEMGIDLTKDLKSKENEKAKIAQQAEKLIKSRRKLYAYDWDLEYIFMKFSHKGFTSEDGTPTYLFSNKITDMVNFENQFYKSITELKQRLEVKRTVRNEILANSTIQKFFNRAFDKTILNNILNAVNFQNDTDIDNVRKAIVERRDKKSDSFEPQIFWVFDLNDVNIIVNRLLSRTQDPCAEYQQQDTKKFTTDLIDELDIVEELARNYGGGLQAEVRKDNLTDFLSTIINQVNDLCSSIELVFLLNLVSDVDKTNLRRYEKKSCITKADIENLTESIQLMNGSIRPTKNDQNAKSASVEQSPTTYFQKISELKIKIYYLLELSKMLEDRIFKDFEGHVKEALELYKVKEQAEAIDTAITWARSIVNIYDALQGRIEAIKSIEKAFNSSQAKSSSQLENLTRMYLGPKSICFTLRVEAGLKKPALTGTPIPTPIDIGLSLTTFIELAFIIEYQGEQANAPRINVHYTISVGVAFTADLNIQIPYTKAVPLTSVIGDAISFSQEAGISKKWFLAEESCEVRNLDQLAARLSYQAAKVNVKLFEGYKDFEDMNKREEKILYQTLDDMAAIARLNRMKSTQNKTTENSQNSKWDLRTLLSLPIKRTSYNQSEGMQIFASTDLSLFMHGASAIKQNIIRSETISSIKEVNHSNLTKEQVLYVLSTRVCRKWAYVDTINFLGNVIYRTIDFELTQDPLNPWIWTPVSATVAYKNMHGFAKTNTTISDKKEKYKAFFTSIISGKSDYINKREQQFCDLIKEIGEDFYKESSWVNFENKISLTKTKNDQQSIHKHAMDIETSIEYYLIPWINKFIELLNKYRDEIYSFTMLGQVIFNLDFFDSPFNKWLIGKAYIESSLNLDADLMDKLKLPINIKFSLNYQIILIESFGYTGGLQGDGFCFLTDIYRKKTGDNCATYPDIKAFQKGIDIEKSWLNFYTNYNYFCDTFYEANKSDIKNYAEKLDKRLHQSGKYSHDPTMEERAQYLRKAIREDIAVQDADLTKFYNKDNFTIEGLELNSKDDLKPGWCTSEQINKMMDKLPPPYRDKLDQRKKLGHTQYKTQEMLSRLPAPLQEPVRHAVMKFNASDGTKTPKELSTNPILAADNIQIISDVAQTLRKQQRDKMTLKSAEGTDLSKLIPNAQPSTRKEEEEKKALLKDTEKFKAYWRRQHPEKPPEFDDFYNWLEKNSRFSGNELTALLVFNGIDWSD